MSLVSRFVCACVRFVRSWEFVVGEVVILYARYASPAN